MADTASYKGVVSAIPKESLLSMYGLSGWALNEGGRRSASENLLFERSEFRFSRGVFPRSSPAGAALNF